MPAEDDSGAANREEQAQVLMQHCSTLRRHYEATGDRDSIDEAVRLLSAAIAALAQRGVSCAALHNNLGFAYLTRYLREKQASDLQRSVTGLTTAVNESAPGEPGAPVRIANLVAALDQLYVDTTDADRWRQDDQAEPQVAAVITALLNAPPWLGNASGPPTVLLAALRVLADYTRRWPEAGALPGLLDQARTQVSAAGENGLAWMLLSGPYWTLYRRAGNLGYLDLVITGARHWLSLRGAENDGAATKGLAYFLNERFSRTGNEADRAEAGTLLDNRGP